MDLILIMWVGLIGPINILGVNLIDSESYGQISAPQRTLNVWAIVLNVSSRRWESRFVGLFIAG